MEDQIISVIIPVYNVQKYLPECLESVLSQDYSALEIILIDDGSTDTSGAVCDAYAARDPRIRVIHQANSGAGAAKNTGLRAATGTYLTFLDSDDYLEPGAYSHMVRLMQQSGADTVQCVLQYLFRDRTEPQIITPGTREYTVLEYLALYPEDWTCALMTEKLFRRALFDGIFFEEGNAIDDEYFTYQGIMRAKKILRNDRVVYNYRQRSSSVMNTADKREKIMLNRLDFMEKRRKNVAARFPELRRHFYTNYLETVAHLVKNPDNTEYTLKQIKAAIRAYFQEEYHPMPGPSFLPALMYAWFTDTRILLKRCRATQRRSRVEQLFD